MGQMGQDTEITIHGSGFSGNTRVAIIPDTSNKAKVLGGIDTQEWTTNVTVTCSTAFLVDYSGLRIIDVSDPTAPTLLGSFISLNANDVAVVGSRAFIVGDDKLKLIDVSDPATPQLIDSFTVPSGYAISVTVADEIAYVLAGELLLIDVNPASPTYLTAIGSTSLGAGFDVAVKNNIAYVATDSLRSLQLIDVSNPAVPQPLGTISTPGDATGVAVRENTAYVTYLSSDLPGGMLVVDVSDPTHPDMLASFATPGDPFGILVRDNLAYIDVLQSGLLVIDVKDSVHPFLLSWIKKSGRGISFIDGTPYMALGHQTSLQVMDVGNLAYPTIMSSVTTPGRAQKLTLSGNTAFVVDGNCGHSGDIGLRLIDVSDRSNPKIIQSIPLVDNGDILDVKVSDSRLYFTKYSSGYLGELLIYDITKPSVPIYLGSYTSSAYLNNFDVAGTTAYVLDGAGDLDIIDVSDPALPVRLRLYALSGSGGDVAVAGNLAYVASNAGGFNVIDVTVPASGQYIIGSLSLIYNFQSITIAGNRAYLANGHNGWQIIDISNPETPSSIGVFNSPGISCEEIAVAGNTVYIAADESGLLVYDVSSPASPAFIGQVETLGRALDISVADNTAYVADECYQGLTIAPVAAEISPVNYVSATELTCTLPAPAAAGRYTIRVFDDTGDEQLLGAITFMEQLPKSKAVIVAGYGPHSSNKVWDETFFNASHAYRVLLAQGYAKENIRYLSAVSVDLDDDNISDVFGDANLVNLQQSILSWGADADDLIIYLVGHGSYGNFIIKHTDAVTEMLPAVDLADLLDNLQNTTGKRAICLYDACYSGSFVNPLKIPAGGTFDRTLMTSSAAAELALLGNMGLTSFSYQFWEHVLAGNSLIESFNFAAALMKQFQQTPLLDGNCDGIPNTPADSSAEMTIGRGYGFQPPPKPYIICSSGNTTLNDSSTASFWVKVISAYPITRVWAEIIPPNYNPLDPYAPALTSFELTYESTTGRYQGSYAGFVKGGTHLVAIYAINNQQTISLPRVSKITVPVFPWNLFLPAITGKNSLPRTLPFRRNTTY